MINYSQGTNVLCHLLIIQDIGTIKAILNYANVEEHKKIIFSLIENGEFIEVIYKDTLSLFGILIEVLSVSDVKHVKESIAFEHGGRLCYIWMCENNWSAIDVFLNWAFTSPGQIDAFKSKLEKVSIVKSLFRQGKYEIVYKFMSWCFDSEEKINQFKKHFAKNNDDILLDIADSDFCSFEKFTVWRFDSEQEVNNFKSDLLQSKQMRKTIVFWAFGCGYNFEFIDKFINWCCHSNEEIKQFKEQFVFSEEWMEILQRFVSNNKMENAGSNWDLIKKLMKLFSPSKEDITKLKEKIEIDIDFNEFFPANSECYKIKKEDLFCLLDNDSYDVSKDRNCACPCDNKLTYWAEQFYRQRKPRKPRKHPGFDGSPGHSAYPQ